MIPRNSTQYGTEIVPDAYILTFGLGELVVAPKGQIDRRQHQDLIKERTDDKR